MSENRDKRIINNAVSAYFLLGPLLLLNKTTPQINNAFVRGHAKTASYLLIWFILLFFLLNIFSFLGNYSLFWFNIFFLLSTTVLLLYLSLFVYGAVKAYKWETFAIKQIPSITGTSKILKVSESTVTREKDKTSIILSYIPFLWYFLYPKLSKYPSIRSVNKINLYSTIIIMLFYTSWRNNIATLLFLAYIIYVTFTAVKLFVDDHIKIVNLEKFWSFEESYVRVKAFVLYIYNYSSRDHRFREYALYLKIERARVTKQAKLMLKTLLPRKSLPFPKWILYIPFINMVGVFFLDTRYKTHIINGFCVNILLIIIWIFTGFNSIYSLFILFPISYGLAYQRKIDYKFPVVYDIAKVEMKAWSKAREVVEEVNKKRKENKEVTFSVKKTNNT